MLEVIKTLLLKIIEDIDAGNSSLDESEEEEVIHLLKQYTDKTEHLSKYDACRYLNISRTTFGRYLRNGIIPKGTKRSGFKELSWTKKDLDKAIDNINKQNNGRR